MHRFLVLQSVRNRLPFLKNRRSRTAMSNPNGLLSQISCHYLKQGRILKDLLMRAALGMNYFDLIKLNLA